MHVSSDNTDQPRPGKSYQCWHPGCPRLCIGWLCKLHAPRKQHQRAAVLPAPTH